MSRNTIFLTALIALTALTGGCTVVYPDGTQVRINSSLGGGYYYPVYGGYVQPIHIPRVMFGSMIRNNVRLVYVDGEARECDVRPGKTASCYDGPENWGAAMIGRR